MNELITFTADRTPALIAAAGNQARKRFYEFFNANIRNPHTRRAYARSVGEFLAWCEVSGFRRSWPSSQLMSRPISKSF
jgi:hypothetical protein